MRDEVIRLLESSQLELIEAEIVSRIGSHVNWEYMSFMIESALRQIGQAGLSPAEIESILSHQRAKLIEFGVTFLRDEAATSDEEEYPEGEEPDSDETPVTLSDEGYGVGFAVTYAIYLNCLQQRSQHDFVEYLKAVRIPHAARFARELKRVYNEIEET